MWKTVVQACKMLKSLSKTPWGSPKEILLIYHFSLSDEGGENKICQFLNFSVYFWKFWLRQGGLSFYGFHKGYEGADTDLMFQFCLPNHYCARLPPCSTTNPDLGDRFRESYGERGHWLSEQSDRVTLALQQDLVGRALNHHTLKHKLIQIY